MFERWGLIVTAAPRLVIALVLLAVTAFGLAASHLRYIMDVDGQMPTDSALTAGVLETQERFGARETLAFLVRAPDAQARLSAACAVSRYLESQPFVSANSVLGPGSNAVKYIEERDGALAVTGLAAVCEAPAGLDAAAAEGLGPQRQFLIAPDGSLLVYADLSPRDIPTRDAIRAIDAWLKANTRPNVQIAYSGQPRFQALANEFSRRIALFMPGIIAMILLLHWEALRSAQAVIIPIVTGALATIAGLGVHALLGGVLDSVSALAPVLILAVGAGHSVQLLKRYMEELAARVDEGRADAAQNRAAVVAAVAALGPVLSLAVLGAAGCLFALNALHVPALAHFGTLAGSGIVAALALELTLIPAIRTLLKSPKVNPQFGKLSPWWRVSLAAIERAAMTWPRGAIAAGLLALMAVLVVGIGRIHVNSAFSVYFGESLPQQRALKGVVESGVAPYSLDVVIDTGAPDGVFDPDALAQALSLEAMLASAPGVRAVTSPASVMQFLKCRFTAAADCSAVRMETAEEAAQIWTFLYGGDGGRLVDPEARRLRVRAFAESDASASSSALLDQVNAWRAQTNANVIIGGSTIVAIAIEQGMFTAALEKALLLLAIVTTIAIAAFRNIVMGLIFAAASGLTLLANYSFLGWAGLPLNTATAVSASVAVGIGVDYLLYMSFRLREGLRAGLGLRQAMRTAHANAGGAALCVALAVAAAFALLGFSLNYHVHQWIAMLLPVTMLTSLFGALFLLPAMVRTLRPRLS